jgi:hypothetical protein
MRNCGVCVFARHMYSESLRLSRLISHSRYRRLGAIGADLDTEERTDHRADHPESRRCDCDDVAASVGQQHCRDSDRDEDDESRTNHDERGA